MNVQLSAIRSLGGVLAVIAYLAASLAVARAATPRHLWVALVTPASLQYSIARFPLVNGLPAKNPDLVYENGLPPMTVGADGTLYANVPPSQLGGSQASSIIDVYLPGAISPSRAIALPDLPGFTSNTALAVGLDGFLYAGYDSYSSGSIAGWAPVPAKHAVPFHGIAVYGPQANGPAMPRSIYTFPGIQAGPSALAMGPERDLYVGGYTFSRAGGHLITIQDPWQGPNIVSRLETDRVLAIAFADQTRDLYLLEETGSLAFRVETYHRGAHGNAQPYRTFNLSQQDVSFALVDKNLYVSTNSDELLAYPKDANGNPKPSFSRSFPGFVVIGVAAGP